MNDYSNLIAAIAAVILILPIVWSPVKKFIDWIKEIIRKKRELRAGLMRIVAEMSPNGGKSIKDAIARIDASTKTMEFWRKSYMDLDERMLFTSDDLGHCTWVNKAYLKFSGTNQEEILGENWINCVFPEDRDKVIIEWNNAVKNKRSFDLQYRWKNGQDVYVHSVIGSGSIGYLGVIYILKEEKRFNEHF